MLWWEDLNLSEVSPTSSSSNYLALPRTQGKPGLTRRCNLITASEVCILLLVALVGKQMSYCVVWVPRDVLQFEVRLASLPSLRCLHHCFRRPSDSTSCASAMSNNWAWDLDAYPIGATVSTWKYLRRRLNCHLYHRQRVHLAIWSSCDSSSSPNPSIFESSSSSAPSSPASSLSSIFRPGVRALLSWSWSVSECQCFAR